MRWVRWETESEMLCKNKNPTLRMWGTRTPHLGCGEIGASGVSGCRGPGPSWIRRWCAVATATSSSAHGACALTSTAAESAATWKDPLFLPKNAERTMPYGSSTARTAERPCCSGRPSTTLTKGRWFAYLQQGSEPRTNEMRHALCLLWLYRVCAHSCQDLRQQWLRKAIEPDGRTPYKIRITCRCA